jgi:hypothetical protein
MNPNAKFERDLEQWLQTEAPASAPAGFHASVMDRARTLRQRPGWATSLPVRRFGRGRGMTLLAAAALLLVGGAWAAGSGFLRLPSIVPPVPAPSFGVVATASPGETSPRPSDLAGPSAGPTASPVTSPGGIWITTGTMGTPLNDHTAVRLLDGRVLVLGESTDGSGATSAELYDPLNGTWTATASMANPREGDATLLDDGRVLVGDLEGRSPDDPTSGTYGAEIYDPQSGAWTATGRMVNGGAVATLLRDGKVLVTGNGVLPTGNGSAQVFDPDNGTWTATGQMINPRHSHAAVLLPDGKVLVVGGHVVPDFPTDSAELFDPDTGTWTAIANMHTPRELINGFLQSDGTVLVLGSSGGDPQSVELYDPARGTWTAAGDLSRPGLSHAFATLLQDGRVLLTGYDNTAELYHPVTGSWSAAAPMLRPHAPPAILLLDGAVLVAGGNDCLDGVCVANGAAELYVPAGVAPPPLPAFPSPPPPVIPTPTPRPSAYPPATGPVPPNARPWTVTVVNDSAQPATLFLAEDDASDTLDKLCGSVTPNVVPAGVTQEVSFLLPARNVEGCALLVNPVPGDLGGLFETFEVPKAGKVWITADGQIGWLGS